MQTELSEAVVATIKSAAGKLTGFDRRRFQAEVAKQHCEGSPRRAERIFGWGREAVNTGLNECRTGIRCCDDFASRGRHKTEEQWPERIGITKGGASDRPAAWCAETPPESQSPAGPAGPTNNGDACPA
jgi:hypothetical protein